MPRAVRIALLTAFLLSIQSSSATNVQKGQNLGVGKSRFLTFGCGIDIIWQIIVLIMQTSFRDATVSKITANVVSNRENMVHYIYYLSNPPPYYDYL